LRPTKGVASDLRCGDLPQDLHSTNASGAE
jgi:hypothetical protein